MTMCSSIPISVEMTTGIADKRQKVKTHMINPVSSASAASQTFSVPNGIPAKPQPVPLEQSQDTAQLSAKAQAHAGGDVDHDGDSH